MGLKTVQNLTWGETGHFRMCPASINLERKFCQDGFLGNALYAGGIWKGDTLIADLEELETMDASEIYHGPRLYGCQVPNALRCPSPPPQTPNAFICVSPNAFICVSPNAFICVSPNAFVCVSPNASAESATELASLTCLCSLRSHVIKQSKLKFLSKERIFCRVWLQKCHGIQRRVHWQRASNLNNARRCGSVLVAGSEGECWNVRPILASSPHSRASLIRTQCLSFVLNFLHTCFRCFQTCAHVIILPTHSRWFWVVLKQAHICTPMCLVVA